MKIFSFIFIHYFLSTNLASVESRLYEIWKPNFIKQMLENNTQLIADFIQSETSKVSDTINSYVDVAQQKTEAAKKEISYFFETKTSDINNTMLNYMERAKSISDNLMNNMNIMKVETPCGYDPDVHLNSVQIITRHGYPAETHTVITEDGYLLGIHRIPRGKKVDGARRQPVFLQHGLLGSSADWIIPGPKKGLAYILADAGYDVWMGNARGNTYSRAHVKLSIDEKAFWDFSWHEIALYDISAAIDYINDVTQFKGEVIYIGHSMGTTVLFTLLSMRPEYNTHLKAAFTLAPVAYMANIQSPIKFLAPYADDIEIVARFLGKGEFLPQGLAVKWLARYGCEVARFEEKICENALFVLCGYDEQQFNRSLVPIILSHTPAGTSTKTLVHFAQEIEAKGRFQMYDYGEKENKIKYGTKVPPEYPLNKITLPIGMFVADNDWLSATVDAKSLYKQLQNPIDFYLVPMKEFNHLDYIWGIDAPILVYKKLFELMKNFRPRQMAVEWSFNINNLQIPW